MRLNDDSDFIRVLHFGFLAPFLPDVKGQAFLNGERFFLFHLLAPGFFCLGVLVGFFQSVGLFNLRVSRYYLA
jgi:hypothetical protein